MKEKHRQFIQKNKTEIIIFISAFLIRLILLAAILWWQGVVGDFDGRPMYLFPVLGGDAKDYYILANNLIDFQQFSLSEGEPFFPESLRAPGYPFFVLLVIVFFKNIINIAIIQDILIALSVVLFYRTAKLFFSPKVSLAAAILLAFEPTNVFFSNVVLTEPLFFFLLILFMYYFLSRQEQMAKIHLFASGLILGLATITRPIGQFLLFFFLGYFFYKNYQLVSLKKIILAGFLFLIGFCLVVGPWSIRNKVTFGSWQLSSVAIFNVYQFHVPLFLAQKNKIAPEVVIKEFEKRFDGDKLPKYKYWTLYNAKEFEKISLQYIKDDWVNFSRFYFVKTLPFFLTDSLRDIARSLKLISVTPVNLTDMLLDSDLKGIFQTIFRGNLEFNLFLLGFSFWLLISLLMLYRSVIAFWRRRKEDMMVLFFMLIILYFALATGPVATGRFRLPAAPLMFLLAVSGWQILSEKIISLKQKLCTRKKKRA